METLTDYVKWMGNLDFDQSPLRAADAMILCVISYFDLSPVFGDGRKSVPVSDCVQMIEEGRARLIITGGDLGNLALFDAAVRTKRFGSLIMSDYTDISQTEPPLQFSAVTFTHRDSFSFIAFRGTDSSLAGWKENFMISFTKTRAQQLAEIYAADRISRGGNWYIAGHSKGGNLALYAACRLSDEELARVLHVYILDGPGLCPEVMDTELIRRVDPVTTCIIPEFDVIGKLFEPGITDTRIVKSFRDGLLQHSLPSWLIDHGELATAEKNTPRSLRLNEVMDSWIENRPPRERAIFVDELFEALDKAGVTDFSRMTLESLADTMLTLRNASETTRAILTDLGSRAFHVNELELPPEALPVAEEIQKVIASVDPLPGAREFLDRLREETQVLILSDTFTQFATPLMKKLGWPTLFCNSLEVAPDGAITGYKMRVAQSKLATVRALQSVGFETIAAGDSFNDLAMIQASKAGFLFRSTEQIRKEHPELPAFEEYDDLLFAIRKAL